MAYLKLDNNLIPRSLVDEALSTALFTRDLGMRIVGQCFCGGVCVEVKRICRLM